MYLTYVKLARASKDAVDVRSARDVEMTICASLWAPHCRNLNRPTNRMVREQFLAWVQVRFVVHDTQRGCAT